MYEIARYTGANDLGTAVVLEAMIETPVERLVVASSMSVYGEGLYSGSHAAVVQQVRRSEEHTSELQSLMRISYAVFCLKKKNTNNRTKYYNTSYTNHPT